MTEIKATSEQLNDLFFYERESGKLFRRLRYKKPEIEVGTPNKPGGALYVTVKGQRCSVARIIYKMKEPKLYREDTAVKFRNKNPQDNRWRNLVHRPPLLLNLGRMLEVHGVTLDGVIVNPKERFKNQIGIIEEAKTKSRNYRVWSVRVVLDGVDNSKGDKYTTVKEARWELKCQAYFHGINFSGALLAEGGGYTVFADNYRLFYFLPKYRDIRLAALLKQKPKPRRLCCPECGQTMDRPDEV